MQRSSATLANNGSVASPEVIGLSRGSVIVSTALAVTVETASSADAELTVESPVKSPPKRT